MPQQCFPRFAFSQFSDICARYQGRCKVGGDLFWSTEFLNAVDAKAVTFPSFKTSTGGVNYANDLGGNYDQLPLLLLILLLLLLSASST